MEDACARSENKELKARTSSRDVHGEDPSEATFIPGVTRGKRFMDGSIG
jgi:hypothetical protein